nr:hypothetical protein GCM10020092_036970 [Actinoplanes digitatis]
MLDIDHDNLRAALGWAVRNDPGRALLLGVSLWRYWLARGHFVEGAGWLERVLALAPEPSPDRARALFALAVLEARRGRSDRLSSLGAAALAAAERSGTPTDAIQARLMRGILLVGVAEIDEVERVAEAALAGDGTPPVAATAHWLAALAALFREDVRTAVRRFAACLRHLSLVDPAAAPFLLSRHVLHAAGAGRRRPGAGLRGILAAGLSGSAPCRATRTRCPRSATSAGSRATWPEPWRPPAAPSTRSPASTTTPTWRTRSTTSAAWSATPACSTPPTGTCARRYGCANASATGAGRT